MIKKSELKNGDKVYYRNGAYRIVKDNNLLSDKFDIVLNNLSNYNEHLICCVNNVDLDIVKVERLIVFERKEVLDKKEKKYLSNIVKPFRDEIEYIAKRNIGETQEYIFINFYDEIGTFSLPCFDKNTMYKNMEVNIKYTLKELDL